jgi:hypothetical protein
MTNERPPSPLLGHSLGKTPFGVHAVAAAAKRGPSGVNAGGHFHRHIGRSWHGTPLEDVCPCGKAPCGLVDTDRIDESCTQHGVEYARTMRQAHWADDCPVACSVDGGEQT